MTTGANYLIASTRIGDRIIAMKEQDVRELPAYWSQRPRIVGDCGAGNLAFLGADCRTERLANVSPQTGDSANSDGACRLSFIKLIGAHVPPRFHAITASICKLFAEQSTSESSIWLEPPAGHHHLETNGVDLFVERYGKYVSLPGRTARSGTA